MTPHKKYFSGCLVGQALGDALGHTIEGFPPAMCKDFIEQHLSVPTPFFPPHHTHVQGQYTDDSQLARELMLSYVERGQFDPGDYAERIANIFQDNRIVGRGRATEEAAHRIVSGVPWQEAGTSAPSAGNGSAMRAAPIGLMFYDDPEGLIYAAHDQGRITHADPRCSAGAVAVAGMVAMALVAKEDPITWLEQVSKWVEKIDKPFAEYILKLEEWANLQPDEAVIHISRCGSGSGYDYLRTGISPFVIPSVLWSLYSFLRSPDDYMEVIRTAITAGGDTDTTAAMAGAISGAYIGLDGLPQELVGQVTDQGTWGFTELVDLAHGCHTIKH